MKILVCRHEYYLSMIPIWETGILPIYEIAINLPFCMGLYKYLQERKQTQLEIFRYRRFLEKKEQSVVPKLN